MTPLADRLRPDNIKDVVGQKHLLAEGKALRRVIDSRNIPNLIFYGPSGVGKTTVANIIAKESGKSLYKLNATTASIADVREVIGAAKTIENQNGILLYLDEIQYFNKKQQQTLLESIENGNVTLIASTTENPYFYVYNAVLSRSTVFEFKALTADDIIPAIKRAAKILGEENTTTYSFEGNSLNIMAQSCGGDVRKALNSLELCAAIAEKNGKKSIISEEAVRELTQKSAMRYDREGDEHYDILSAYQKSMRGSDPDAAVHYLCRLLEAGDLPGACRRLMVCASEDVGLAWPQILPIVKSAVDIAQAVGLPEARIPLADAVILVATAPKSNSAYCAVNSAFADIRAGKSGPIPRQLQNKHFDGEDQKAKGQFYKYAHDFENHWVEQQYLPDTLKNTIYYRYGDNKNEQAFSAYWDKIKKK